MSGHPDPQSPLAGFARRHEFFVGVDSDGCAFDTMEVKHKECFIPQFVKHFGLAAVSRFVRETAEFVNLYSRDRGVNRFPGYLKVLDLLAERPEVRERGFRVPALIGLREWVENESRLANPALKGAAETTGDPDLALAYAWSVGVNQAIEETVRGVPPFPLVRESLERLAAKADVMVVSATPGEALTREWREQGLSRYVGLIAGQEMGGKKDHLATAAGPGRYARDKVLMIGDAPGDRAAAEANGVLFYPINPGREDESWRRFFEDAMPRFFAGGYSGRYMDERVAEFEAILPETPTWKRS